MTLGQFRSKTEARFFFKKPQQCLANPLKNQYIIVFVTATNRHEAEEISQILLEAKLIACANVVGPVESHFHWGGKVEQAEEFLVMMKSRSDLFEKLSAAVAKLHSYEVPEIIAIPIVTGSKSYLAWLENTLR